MRRCQKTVWPAPAPLADIGARAVPAVGVRCYGNLLAAQGRGLVAVGYRKARHVSSLAVVGHARRLASY